MLPVHEVCVYLILSSVSSVSQWGPDVGMGHWCLGQLRSCRHALPLGWC